MTQDTEISHLLDLMPASGRMITKLISKPQQKTVIDSPFPLPWKPIRQVFINFELWQNLSRSQRDLLLLRTVCWLSNIRWIKLDINQGVALAGIVGTVVEISNQDAVGVMLAGSLAAIGLTQIWKSNHSSQVELEADEMAIRVSLRRGYLEAEAARALLQAIERVAEIEGRTSLNFIELVRCQNLRTIGKLSSVAVPDSIRQETR
ncbi:DUF3318 domain-containing protein [Limnoraphis robusta Tam1]|uniref:DUF3318 domain-containing protein n=1 Tax=Limnoraphis robusta TaxID=1118279 RepID=UPI002B1FA437|nr:DUF3318 domain-containing protein [Limnoraphis robusta]MEA5538404.1 DUF3318 domain-containing protein [Limnoraphis robusta Tam1]